MNLRFRGAGGRTAPRSRVRWRRCSTPTPAFTSPHAHADLERQTIRRTSESRAIGYELEEFRDLTSVVDGAESRRPGCGRSARLHRLVGRGLRRRGELGQRRRRQLESHADDDDAVRRRRHDTAVHAVACATTSKSDYDYAYVAVSEDGGLIWTTVAGQRDDERPTPTAPIAATGSPARPDGSMGGGDLRSVRLPRDEPSTFAFCLRHRRFGAGARTLGRRADARAVARRSVSTVVARTTPRAVSTSRSPRPATTPTACARPTPTATSVAGATSCSPRWIRPPDVAARVRRRSRISGATCPTPSIPGRRSSSGWAARPGRPRRRPPCGLRHPGGAGCARSCRRADDGGGPPRRLGRS